MTGSIANALRRYMGAMLVVVAAFLSWGVLTTPCHAQGRTKDAMERLPPQEADRVAREDLLSVLAPSGRFHLGVKPPPRAKLSTISYGTKFPGVCRRDALNLLYTPTRDGASPWKAPLKPYGFEATPLFHIAHLPEAEPGLDDLHVPLIAQPDCKDVDGQWRKRMRAGGEDDDSVLARGAEWFTAPDLFHGVQAGFVYQMALGQVKAGTLKPEPCPDVERFERTCLGQIMLTDLTEIYAVESCPAADGSVCYDIYFLDAGAVLTIKALAEEKKLVPTRILSIAVDEFGCILITQAGRCQL